MTTIFDVNSRREERVDYGSYISGDNDEANAKSAKETQIIAIYGKGGIGKSFTLANLSYMMAQQGKRVLLIGCDPKSDTTSLLFGGRACPTIIETSSRRKLEGAQVAIGDVCFKRDGVFAMELGGPEVGRGCWAWNPARSCWWLRTRTICTPPARPACARRSCPGLSSTDRAQT
jgi:hypothetical protein